MSDICQQKTRKITQQLLEEVRHELEDTPEDLREDTRRIPTELLEMIRSDADHSLEDLGRAWPQRSEVVVDLEEMLRLSALGERAPAKDIGEHSAEDLFLGFGTELDNLLQHSLFPADSGSFQNKASHPRDAVDDDDAPGAMWINKPLTPSSPRRLGPSSTDAHPRLNLLEDTTELANGIRQRDPNNETPLPSQNQVPSTGWSIDLGGVLDLDQQVADFAVVPDKKAAPDFAVVPDKKAAPAHDSPELTDFTVVAEQIPNSHQKSRINSEMEILQSPTPAAVLRNSDGIRRRRPVPQNTAARAAVPMHQQHSAHSQPTLEARKPMPAALAPQVAPSLPREALAPEPIAEPEAHNGIRGIPASVSLNLGHSGQQAAYRGLEPAPRQDAPEQVRAALQAQAPQRQEERRAEVAAPPMIRPQRSMLASIFNLGTVSGAVMILMSVVPLANLVGGWPWSPWIAAVPALCGTWFLVANAMGLSLNVRRLGFVVAGGLFFSFSVAPALFHAIGVFDAMLGGLPHLLALALLMGALPLRGDDNA